LRYLEEVNERESNLIGSLIFSWSIAEFAYSAVIGTPLTFDKAIESSDKKKWQVSMDKEIDAHHRNKTWKLVPRPDEKSVIDNKWIYRIKIDGAGNAI